MMDAMEMIVLWSVLQIQLALAWAHVMQQQEHASVLKVVMEMIVHSSLVQMIVLEWEHVIQAQETATVMMDPMEMIVLWSIVNGQTGLHGDHVLKAVVVEPKHLQDPKLCRKVMVELVQAQVKNPSLVIAKAALVSFHLGT